MNVRLLSFADPANLIRPEETTDPTLPEGVAALCLFFASRLERAPDRSASVRPPKLIEAKAKPSTS
jgi:hypothetical protein